MCRLADYCIYDSAEKSTCALSAEGSSGELHITVQKDERLLVYDLEGYLGKGQIKRPDYLLIGRVGDGPWVVVLVDLKSGTGWGKALEQFRGVLPALGKGGEDGGERHHRECADRLPLGRGHPVIAVVVGQVGREYRKSFQPGGLGDRRRKQTSGVSWGGKPVRVVPPMSSRPFRSLRDFWVQLGILKG